MDNKKYYLVKRKTDNTYPIVNIQNLTNMEFGRANILECYIGDPKPRKPVIADFLRGARDIFAKRITDVMQTMNMEGIRYFPAEIIDDFKGIIYDNYVCVYADDNTYKLMDENLSDYEYEDGMYSFSKFVIDRKKLNEIPLNKRLCIRIYEILGYTLYHQSVVDAVMKLEPTGMYFQDIEDYEIL